MNHTTSGLLLTGLVALPIGVAGGVAVAHSSSTHPTATPTAKTGATARPSATPQAKKKVARAVAKPTPAPLRTITGPSVDMDWGPVQATLVVQGKRLVDVRISAPTERARSAFINQQAVPWLRQETLQAQSANINLISGATLTSEAYAQSLQAALDAAHL